MRILPFAIAAFLRLSAAAAERDVEFGRAAASSVVSEEGESSSGAPPLRRRAQSAAPGPRQRKLQVQKGKERRVEEAMEDEEEEEYDPYLGLSPREDRRAAGQQRGRRHGRNDPQDRRRHARNRGRRAQESDASMSMSMSTPADACTFCPDGLPNPEQIIPTADQVSCLTAKTYAETMMASEPMCATTKLAEALCCPPTLPDDVASQIEGAEGIGPVIPDAPVDPAPAPVDDPAPTPSLCSCSPRAFTITLDLGQDCSDDLLEGAPGIGMTYCVIGSHGGRRKLRQDASAEMDSAGRRLFFSQTVLDGQALTLADLIELKQNAPNIVITSIQFLEFDTSGGLRVINQNDDYYDVALGNGAVLEFPSVSADLDPSKPIEEQLDYLPGGGQMSIRGKYTSEDTGEERIVSNRVAWSYTNACDVVPIEPGARIGWVDVTGTEPASPDFCPAVPDVPAPATTVPATEAPPATTAAATEPPATCDFCPDGVVDPTLGLPTGDGSTCGQVAAFAPSLAADDAQCNTIKLAERFCCPAAPETTEAPPETTEAPVETTEAPPATTAAATEAPPETTEAPPETTEAPPPPAPETTEAPPVVPPPATEAPPVPPPATAAPPTDPDDGWTPPATGPDVPMFGKSQKGKGGSKGTKSAKAKTKKDDVHPKTNKTHKNPMAKVVKDPSSKDGSKGKGDAKSGKAVADVDAKAEKQAAAKSGKGAKNAKLAKVSTKSAKAGADGADGGKGKGGPKSKAAYHLFGKATGGATAAGAPSSTGGAADAGTDDAWTPPAPASQDGSRMSL